MYSRVARATLASSDDSNMALLDSFKRNSGPKALLMCSNQAR